MNHFHAAGGMGVLIRELEAAGLLHGDARTVWGERLADYAIEPHLDDGGEVRWRPAPDKRATRASCAGWTIRSSRRGACACSKGLLAGRSSRPPPSRPSRHVIEAPARVFHTQEELHAAFRAGELDRDVVAVLRFQGPKAIGMPELHKLMPPLGVLQDRGHRVALVTDGRLSGASGKVPAALHVTPEAAAGGAIGKIRDGDVIRLDARAGRLDVMVPAEVWSARPQAHTDLAASHVGIGRELFSAFRGFISGADEGATIFPAA